MLFLDIPAIPLPRVLTALLGACGVYTRDKAGPVLGSDPERYSMRESADASGEWNRILHRVEDDVNARVRTADFLGLPATAIVRALLRLTNAKCVSGFRFFRMVQLLYPSRDRHVLALPKGLRTALAAHGLRLDDQASRLVWFVCKVALVIHASGRLCREFILAVVDSVPMAQNSEGRPILCWGISAAEMRSGAGELNLLDFVREGRLPLLKDRPALYVHAPWSDQTLYFPEITTFVCHNAVRATHGQRLRLRELAQLLRDSLTVGLRILLDALRDDGLLLLLAQEYARLPRMRLWFRKAEPSAIVITNSMYSSQPLWMAYASACDCEVVMLFYATNVLPLYLRGDPDPEPGDPGYRLLECNRFEVWTPGQGQWLASLGVSPEKVHVAGVIVWGRYDALERDRRSNTASRNQRVRVGVFDVVPVNRQWFNRYGFGDNYYSVARMSQVLVDVIEVAGEVFGEPPEICLKPKRGRLPVHDQRYVDLVDDLERQGRLVAGALPENPIEAVAACDMVLSAPFSSPSVIAAQMGTPSCFYDPGELLRLPPIVVSPDVPLISGREHLRQWLLQNRNSAAGRVLDAGTDLDGRHTVRTGAK
jgi:hypothetical protein